MSRYRKMQRDLMRGLHAHPPQQPIAGLPIVPSLAAASRSGAVVLANARAPAGSQLAVSSDAGPTAGPDGVDAAVYNHVPGPAGQSIRVAFRGTDGVASLDTLIDALATHRRRAFGGPADDAPPTLAEFACDQCGEPNVVPVADDSPLRAALEKAQAFKTWVHAYLDSKGIPADPGPHKAEGCRIGDRMDYVFDLVAAASTPSLDPPA